MAKQFITQKDPEVRKEPADISLNRAVKNARKSLGLSQKEFVSKLEIESLSQIGPTEHDGLVWYSKLENDRLPLPLSVLEDEIVTAIALRISELTGLSLEWLASLQLCYVPHDPNSPALEHRLL